MASTRQRTLWVRWKLGAFVALTAGTLVGACGNSKPADDGNGGGGNDAAVNACATPSQGCSCSGDGTTAACGQVVSRSDGYVSCSEGTRTCTGGTWGACVGQYTMFKSAGTLGGDLTIQGLGTPMSDAGACTVNPCDPNCLGFVDNSNGLDGGSSLVATDAGGWTLALTSPDGGGCVGFQCQIASCDGGMKTAGRRPNSA